MSSDPQTFIDALARLEADGASEALVSLYSEQATSTNLTGNELSGPDGARRFWEADRSLFDTVHSEFRTVISQGDVTVLEWRRTGRGRGGQEIDLPGVSVIEYDSDGKIVRFAGYTDPAALGEQSL